MCDSLIDRDPFDSGSGSSTTLGGQGEKMSRIKGEPTETKGQPAKPPKINLGALLLTGVRGTITSEYVRRADGHRTGPYSFLRYREGGRQRRLYLRPEMVPLAKEAIATWHRLHPPSWRMRQNLATLRRKERTISVNSNNQLSSVEKTTQQNLPAQQGSKQYSGLIANASAVESAMSGWQEADNKDWEVVCREAVDRYKDGSYTLEALGAERLLTPETMAVLGSLRKSLVAAYPGATAAQMMLADAAIVAFYNMLKIQGWIGNISLLVEEQFFGPEAINFRSQKGGGHLPTLEELIYRKTEKLMPLLDRSNRMLIRNLRAMKEIGQNAAPSVSINQINLDGQQQLNVVGNGRA
jgi:hypothetical protein